MTEGPVAVVATSALEARAAVLGRGSWNGELAVLDAALEALDEPDPLVVTVTGANGRADVRVLAVGRRSIALAAPTPEGVRAARYVLEA
jgi:hypothetical protein